MPRKTNKIKSNRTILIVVEGPVEDYYFSQLKNFERISGLKIVSRIASHSSIYHVLKTALMEETSKAYDSIWCVFDRDTTLNSNITSEVKKQFNDAKKKKINFADSFPSFELWFLLHYAIPKGYYANQNKLIIELQRYISNYSKERKWQESFRLYNTLKSLQNVALENAEKLNNKVKNDGDLFCNVDKLIKEILENKAN